MQSPNPIIKQGFTSVIIKRARHLDTFPFQTLSKKENIPTLLQLRNEYPPSVRRF